MDLEVRAKSILTNAWAAAFARSHALKTRLNSSRPDLRASCHEESATDLPTLRLRQAGLWLIDFAGVDKAADLLDFNGHLVSVFQID